MIQAGYISILLSLSFLMVDTINAETIELANPQYEKEFLNYINNGYKLKSFKNFQISNKINHTDKLLASKYKIALNGLLEINLTNSIQIFKEISTYPKNEIFSLKSQEIISKSFLHLASINKENSDYWIKKAANFNPSFIPSSETFNPLIIKAYEIETNKIKLHSKSDYPFINNADIFINGTRNKRNLIKNHNYYVTIYRDGHLPFKEIINSNNFSKLKSLQTTFKSLELGTCGNPKFKNRIDKIYFNPQCIRSRFNNNDFNLANNFQKHSKSMIDLNFKVKDKKKVPLLKKKSTWLVIGASILATSAVIIINDQSKNSSTFKPVHRTSSK